MPDTAFGQTALRPSALAFGCNHIALNRGRSRRREAEAALTEAHEAGINFFDIADVYARGESERMLGRVLGRHRDRIIICSKAGSTFPVDPRLIRWIRPLTGPVIERSRSAARAAAMMRRGLGLESPKPDPEQKPEPAHDFDPEYIRRAIEASLRRLRTDFLDIFLLHSPPMGVLNHERLFDVLETLKDTGKVRYYGISCSTRVTPADAAACARREGISVLQIPVNVLNMAVFEAVEPVAAERRIAVIAREPFARGGIFEDPDVIARLAQAPGRSPAQAAIRFVAQVTGGSVVLAGMSSRAHVRECRDSLEGEPLHPDIMHALHPGGRAP